MDDLHIFRVTVRGSFFDLSESQRERLVAARDDHHVTRSAYTGEGTFTYDSNIYSFSLRYEVRTDGDQPDKAAAEIGLNQAGLFLRTLGIGYQHLKVTTTDMHSMWAAVEKRRKNQTAR
jgi:Family of unknown function (DUF6204)